MEGGLRYDSLLGKTYVKCKSARSKKGCQCGVLNQALTEGTGRRVCSFGTENRRGALRHGHGGLFLGGAGVI